LGRPAIVSTTIKDPLQAPKHLVADEKHTGLEGEQVYVATMMAAGGSILGAEPAESGIDQRAREGLRRVGRRGSAPG
jgi:hypothetical protein